MIDRSEWKVSSCGIISVNQWLCYERSMEYYYITPKQFHIGWIVVSVAGGIMLMCVSAKLYHPRNNDRSLLYKCCLFIVLYGITMIMLIFLSTLCFIISGSVGVLIVASIWILSMFLVCPFIKWLTNKRYESYWDSAYWHSDDDAVIKNKTNVYDFWKGTAKAKKDKSINVFKYECYDPI